MVVVLHHAGEVRPDFHAGDDPAAVHVERPDQGARPVFDRRLDHPGVGHGPQVDIAMHAAGGDDDGPPGPDVDPLCPPFHIALPPTAFPPSPPPRVHLRPDTPS